MPVTFTDKFNKLNYLIPAPMVNISKEYDRTGDGAIIGVRYPITLSGTLVAHAGVPDYSGSFVNGAGAQYTSDVDDSVHVFKEVHMYKAIQNKQMALRRLFGHHNEGGELHFIPLIGAGTGFKCNPRLVNIEFTQEPGQPNIMKYTITLEADQIQGPTADDGSDSGTCSNPAYVTKDDCEANTATWTSSASIPGKVAAGLNKDPEGRHAWNLAGVTSPVFKYAVKDASENWSVDEQDTKTLIFKAAPRDSTTGVYDHPYGADQDPDHKRFRHITQKDGATGSGFVEMSIAAYEVQETIIATSSDPDAIKAAKAAIKGFKQIGGYRLQQVMKTYILTHTMSATGKRVFDYERGNDATAGVPGGIGPPNLLEDQGSKRNSTGVSPISGAKVGEVDPDKFSGPLNRLGENASTFKAGANESCGLSEIGPRHQTTEIGTVDLNDDLAATRKAGKDFVPDGEAWQQARGYVLNFISGSDPVFRGGGYQKALTEGNLSLDPHVSPHSPTNNPFFGNEGFVDLYGLNLPHNRDGSYDVEHRYTAVDYKRIQQIDKTGGTFSVTETWVLVDSSYLSDDLVGVDIGLTAETMEFSIDKGADSAITVVSINGSITGLVEAADEHMPNKEAEVDSHWNQNKYGLEEAGVFSGNTASKPGNPRQARKDLNRIPPTTVPSAALKCTSKYEEALRRFHWLEPKLHEITQTGTGLLLNPIKRSFTITRNPVAGSINYSLSFDTRNDNCFPCVLNESVVVDDTHPSHVFAETAVLGRRMGPVLQDINTQTSWKRNLNVELSVSGVIHGCDWQEAMKSKPSMLINGCIHPDDEYNTGVKADDYTKCIEAGFTYIDPAVQTCNTGNVLREVIDSISPRDKFGVTQYFVSSGPSESWDAINGEYTFSIEWTYEREEGPFAINSDAGRAGLKKAIGKSYLGTRSFQYPRVLERINQFDHDINETNAHGVGSVTQHQPAF